MKKGLKNNRLVIIAVMMGLVAVLFAPLGSGLAASLTPAGGDSLPAEAKPASLSMQAEARGDVAAGQASKECPCASNKSTDSYIIKKAPPPELSSTFESGCFDGVVYETYPDPHDDIDTGCTGYEDYYEIYQVGATCDGNYLYFMWEIYGWVGYPSGEANFSFWAGIDIDDNRFSGDLNGMEYLVDYSMENGVVRTDWTGLHDATSTDWPPTMLYNFSQDDYCLWGTYLEVRVPRSYIQGQGVAPRIWMGVDVNFFSQPPEEICMDEVFNFHLPASCIGEVECSVEISIDSLTEFDVTCFEPGDTIYRTIRFRDSNGMVADPSTMQILLHLPYGTNDITSIFTHPSTGMYVDSGTVPSDATRGNRTLEVTATFADGCEATAQKDYEIQDDCEAGCSIEIEFDSGKTCFELGETLTRTIRFRDRTGILADPSYMSISLIVGGWPSSITSDFTRLSTGVYQDIDTIPTDYSPLGTRTLAVYAEFPDGCDATAQKDYQIQTACGPHLCTTPDPPSHDFGQVAEGQTADWSFNITNCGIGTLTWSISKDKTWITKVDPSSGSTTTEADTVTVTIDTTGLTTCVQQKGTLTINSNAGIKTGTISVHPAPDKDGDGIPDSQDKCPDDPDPHNVDTDNDGKGDVCDDDDDDDGVLDANDGCPKCVLPSWRVLPSGCAFAGYYGYAFDNPQGKCFGMSWTAAMYHSGDLSIPGRTDKYVYDATKSMDPSNPGSFTGNKKTIWDRIVDYHSSGKHKLLNTKLSSTVSPLFVDELDKIKNDIDAGKVCLVGLGYSNPLKTGDRHGVAAYAYNYDGTSGKMDIAIYDPNHPYVSGPVCGASMISVQLSAADPITGHYTQARFNYAGYDTLQYASGSKQESWAEQAAGLTNPGGFLASLNPLDGDAELHAYDSQARHTGPDGSGGVEKGIPESEYEIDEATGLQVIVIPSEGGEDFAFQVQGAGAGTFNMAVTEVGNPSKRTAVYRDMPFGASTLAEIEVGPDGDRLLKLDEDGDGTFEVEKDADGTFMDSDDDGLSDDWESQYGTQVNMPDAGDDPDNDGLTNYEEYIRGTDPLNPDTDGDGVPDGNDVPPIITNVGAAVPGDTATIFWDTDKPADSLVKYGTQPGVYNWQEYTASLLTSHAVPLTDLQAGRKYYFVVNSTDEGGNPNESPEYDFTTAPPSDEDNPDVAVGLDSIEDWLVVVYGFDNDTKTWTWHNPSWPPEANTLTTLYMGSGYWINVSEDCVLTYGANTYELYEGWNLVGWLGYQEHVGDNSDVAIGLATIGDCLVVVYGFDNATKTWTWYNPSWPPGANTLDTLYMGSGYWINVGDSCTLTYEANTYELYEGWNLIGWLGW